LDAAVRILSRGARDLTTNRVADVAGVSIGSLYQYFPDKQAIFGALLDRHVQQSTAALERAFAARRTSTLPELLGDLFTVSVQAHSAKPALYQFLASQAAGDLAVSRAHAACLQNGLRAALEREGHAPADAEGIAFVLSRQLDTLTHGVILDLPPTLPRELAEAEALRALTGYLTTCVARAAP